MNKKSVFGIFLMIAMLIASSSVLATKGADITDASIYTSGASGIVTGQIHIKNTGSETVNISLSPAILVGSRSTLQIYDVDSFNNVVANDTRVANFKVNLGNGYAGNYTGNVLALVNGAAYDSAPITAEILYNGGGLSIVPNLFNTTQPDSVVKQVITIQNLGNRDISVSIEKTDYAGFVFTLDKEGAYTIPAMSIVNVMGSVVIPAGTLSNTYTGRVTITADSIPYPVLLQTFVESATKASVPEVSISVDPGSSASGSIVISNTGNKDITGMSIVNVPTITDDDGSVSNLTITPSTGISAGVGLSTTVNVLVKASQKMDSGDYIATLTLTGSGITKQFNVKIHVNDLLSISSIDLNKDEFKPGDAVKITVETENIAGDIDLKDVKVKAYLLDNAGNELQDRNGDDIELESEAYKLGAGDTKKVTFETEMPYDVSDEEEITVKIVATGKNEDDSTQKYTVTDTSYTITASKEENKLQIYEAALEADTLSCSRKTYMNVGIRDIGNNDEDDVELAITNSELGISEHEIFDMSNDPDDDEFEVEKSFLLDLEDADKGTYNIKVTVYYNEDKKKEEKTVTVTISDCSTSSSSSSTSTGSTSGSSTGASTSGTTTSPSTGSTTGSTFTYTGGTGSGLPAVTASAVTPKIVNTKDSSGSWTDNIGFLVLIGIANILLIAVIVVAVMYVRK
jgi:hypothetical protein